MYVHGVYRSKKAQSAYEYMLHAYENNIDLSSDIIDFLERDIFKSSEFSYLYSKKIKKTLCEKCKAIILKHARYAYLCALDVIGGEWKEGEGIIMQDPYYAYLYAKNVKKGRFEEAEGTIIKSQKYRRMYKEFMDTISNQRTNEEN